VRDYVAWLLKETPGWDRDHIDEVIRSGERVDVRITPAVPVYWVYVTAWAAPDGVIQFRDDIYQRDGLGLAAAVMPPEPPVAATPVPSRQARSARPLSIFGEDEEN
jgi:murein L,D-transpeptidase YcbB/YkuD